MNIRDTFEKTAEHIGAQVRDTADNVFEKIGSGSREIGERVGDSILARVSDLSDTALARLHLVTERRARQRVIAGVAAGVFIGFLIARLLGGEAGAKRRQAIRDKFESFNGSPMSEDAPRSDEESAESVDPDAQLHHK